MTKDNAATLPLKPPQQPAKKVRDPGVKALADVLNTLGELDHDERQRILRYVNDRCPLAEEPPR